MITPEEIRKIHPSPIVAVIGATLPQRPYKREMGAEVGYHLRKYLEKTKGTIMTGGVYGIGVDSYLGIVKFCRERKLSDDRFFTAIPETDLVEEDDCLWEVEYQLPEPYNELARYMSKSEVTSYRVGKTMEERRTGLAEIADAFVMVNGGQGTLDEALLGLTKGKKVIILEESGGVAANLKYIVESAVSPITGISNVSIRGNDYNNIDPRNIFMVQNAQETVRTLARNFK
ncbi:putative lysine decarboxylase [uncultured archaeon]|nr:putative lysine decarboxylase [uncultured archaeon]